MSNERPHCVSRTIATIGVIVALSASAWAADSRQALRFGAQYVSPTGDGATSDEDFVTVYEPLDSFGPWIGYEYLVAPRIGIEAIVSFQTLDVDAVARDLSNNEVSVVDIGELDAIPFAVGGNYHFPASTGSDLYVGARAAWVSFGDLEVPGSTGGVALKDTFGYGGVVGLDVPVGAKGWGVHAHLEILVFQTETDEPGDTVSIDIDPFIVAVGAIRRF